MNTVRIDQLNYPDFVAQIGQENVPPGGAHTVDWWMAQTDIRSQDHVLDLACTTGFSGRRAHRRTQCAVTGIDLSKAAVIEAAHRAATEFPAGQFSYHACDASDLPLLDRTFSHVLAGCNFAFIQTREVALREVCRTMRTGGKILASNYFYKTPPTTAILDDVERVIGWRPDPSWDHSFWNQFFSKHCVLIGEKITDLAMLDEAEIYNAILNEVTSSPKIQAFSPADRKLIFDRLCEVRLVLNRHRAFQSIALQVWEMK